MSRNNKKKNQKRQQALRPAKVQPVTEEVKKNIDSFTDEVVSDSTMDTENVADLSTPGDKELIQKAETNMDLVPYFNKLKDMHRILKATQYKADDEKKKYEDLSVKIKSDKEQLYKDKKQLEDDRNSYKETIEKDYKNKLDEINKREASVLQRELDLDNNQHSKVLANLLEAFRSSEKKVFDDTENFLTELSDKHQQHLKDLSEIQKEKEDLEKEKEELEREKKVLARQKINLTDDKELQEEDIKETLKAQYAEQMRRLEKENAVFKGKAERLSGEIQQLRETLNNIYATFGNDDPMEMVQTLTSTQEHVAELLKQLEARPLQSDYDMITERLNSIQAKYNEIKSKYDDRERLKLKAQLESSDSFQIELIAKDKALKAAEYREKTLQKQVESMLDTIEIMKGEREKNNKAFEFAYNYDQDSKIQGTTFREYAPNSLSEVCTYVQQFMANGDKPFYYSKHVIATFLAGLHMSNITLLQGISGTGKTSLPREFARALATSPDYTIGDNAPYRICAVQSGWRDNMDLMGYYNAFEHKYNETDFFKALYLAGQPKYKDTLFLIILDEMNLSHPEHYFADFLSLLEQKEGQRFITIRAPQEVCPKSVVEGKLRVPENVRFIGTANQDETTLDFAPKTYDRSNLIEMPKNHPILNLTVPKEHYNITYSWLKKHFKNAEGQYKDEVELFREFLNNPTFKKLMTEMNLGWGNRFEEQSDRFIPIYMACEATSDEDSNLANAADHLITSRLIRTLKAHYELQKDQLGDFENNYSEIFSNHFGSSNLPEQAIILLDEEMKKKA